MIGTRLTEDDLYPGLYVQSAGNCECVYMVQYNNGLVKNYNNPDTKYILVATHKVSRYGVIIQEYSRIERNQIKSYSTYGVDIMKTQITEQLNREYKLNSLIDETV